MNTTASELPREPEVRDRIHKIRTFSRSARALCGALIVGGLFATGASLLAVAFTGIPAARIAEGTTFGLLAGMLAPWQVRVWWLLSQAAVAGAGIATVIQLYHLFTSLANGTIYSPENVRRVRNVGLLMLLSAALGVMLPSIALITASVLADGPVPAGIGQAFRSFGGVLGSLAAAAVVLLASWIMDVGLYEKESADHLQRESDLMI